MKKNAIFVCASCASPLNARLSMAMGNAYNKSVMLTKQNIVESMANVNLESYTV